MKYGFVKYFYKKKVRRKKRKSLEYLKYKKETLHMAEEKLLYFNQFYNLKWNKIFIKNQKTRWGSCSKQGNINFNYRIIFLPQKMADYIIVHELCHLQEFNHSADFWNLVAKVIPDYKEIRQELRKNGFRFHLYVG